MKRKARQQKPARTSFVLRVPSSHLKVLREVAALADLEVTQVAAVMLAMQVWVEIERGTVKRRKKNAHHRN